MKKVLQLTGLDCAHCAAELEAKIARIDGVSSASIAFVNQKLTIEYEAEDVLKKAIDTANHFEEVRVVETENEGSRCATKHDSCTCGHCSGHDHGEAPHEAHEHEHTHGDGAHKKEWMQIVISAVFFLAGILLERLLNNSAGQIIAYILYALAYFTVGYPVLISTGKNIAKGKIFDENFLMTIASVGAVLLGEVSEAVLVMLLYQLGETLQGMAVASSRRSVSTLMDLKSESATLLVSGEQKQIDPNEIKVGDILIVKAGEKIPVDGMLISENASLDTKSLTGESELRTAKKGDELLSGCINAGGVFEMKAIRVYQDSAVSKILDLVENASSGKAAPEKFITKFARYYTPIVCVLALLLAIVAPLLNGVIADGVFQFKNFERWSRSALTFLVVSCPCALIISVPLTYFSGIGACAKQGVLVKGATYLDTVAKAKLIAFDKTGTLTEGNFTVRNVTPAQSVTESQILEIAAAVEKKSSHPLAKAFEKIDTAYTAENVTERAGKGLQATVSGKQTLVGNVELLRENGVEIPPTESVYTLVYVAQEGEYLGAIEIGDSLRKEAKTAIAELEKLGVAKTVMLTGDNALRAQKIANEVGMYEVKAELLPDEKLREAEKLKAEGTLLYVGDGINDAPVMAVSDCAVSMGKLGSAAAVETSDLVLISDRLTAIPKCVRTARKTRKIVMQNIIFSILAKTAFMALGAIGVLPLGLAVFADVGVMLLAVLNSFRVRKIS